MEESSRTLPRQNLNVQRQTILRGKGMNKTELKWGLIGLIGVLCLVLAFTFEPLGFLAWLGFPLTFISLFFGFKDRKKVLT